MSREEQVILGLTIGDMAGIGPELIIRAFEDERLFSMCTPVLFANPKVISYYRKVLDIEKFKYNSIRNFSHLNHHSLNIVMAWEEDVEITPGKPDEVTGKCAFLSIEKACQSLKDGEIEALVTAPIEKSVVKAEGFDSLGHTGYITRFFGAENSLMFMVSKDIKVGLVTEHVPLSQVARGLTRSGIIEKAQIMHRSLKKDFGIDNPKISVLGLNPHAGDNGAIGKEEEEMIIPAVDELRKKGMQVFGPYSADGFFGSGQHTSFDGILAMYHDQGLIPFKYIAFEDGVNYTAGLNVIRTSPDHGTATDIAGKGKADIQSFLNAIYLAIDIARQKRNS